MANVEGGVALHVLDFQDLPKPWLVSLISRRFSDSSTRMALFCTCRVLSQLVVENCTALHIRPAVAELKQRPENCAAISRLATGCKRIHLELQGGSIPITSNVACNITVLILRDTHLNSKTIDHLCMTEMDQLRSVLLTYADVHHRHSAELNEDALFVALRKPRSAALLPCGVRHLSIASEGADDTCNTLKRLHTVLGDSLVVLKTRQVSGLRALHLYTKLTVLDIDDTDQDALTKDEQLQLITHPTLKHVIMPGMVWPMGGPDFSGQVWQLDSLKLSFFGGSSYTLTSLPLQGVKRLMIEGGFDGMDEMYEEILMNLQRCHQVSFLPTVEQTVPGIPGGLPVLHIDHCLDPQVIKYAMHRYKGTCLSLTHSHWRIQLHHLEGLAHIPAHVTTLALASWQVSREDGCTWVQVWQHLPAHVSHIVLVQVDIIKNEMLALFEEPLRPALQQVTLAFIPSSKATGWVQDAAEELAAIARSKWADRVQLVLKTVPAAWEEDDDLSGPEGVDGDENEAVA